MKGILLWATVGLLVLIAISVFRRITGRTIDVSGKEIPIIAGNTGGSDGPLLQFAISNVRKGQKVQKTPPYVSPGGEWTVFDCLPGGDPSAVFTVGVLAPKPLEGSDVPLSFSRAIFFANDREKGERLLGLFAREFRQSVPVPKSPQPLQPLQLATAVLGENMDGSPGGGGGFRTGSGGTWTATKWFLQNEGLEAEVYFNYDLKNLRGAFTEKDQDYNADLIASVAAVVRDGPRPPRTPETDPNLTDVGPRVQGLQPIPKSRGRAFQFLKNGEEMLLYDFTRFGGSVTLVNLALPAQQTEVYRANAGRVIDGVYPADAGASLLLVVEANRSDPHTISFGAPLELFLVDRRMNGATVKASALTGPWENAGRPCGEKPLSPDGRYILVVKQSNSRRGQPNPDVFYSYDVQACQARAVELPDRSRCVGWTESAGDVRAVIVVGSQFEPQGPKLPKAFLLDPATGATEAMPEGRMTSFVAATGPDISPDGKFRISLTPHEQFTITNVASGEVRAFIFHEDDRRSAGEYCLEWKDPRFIAFDPGRQAFIDIQTMKMSYLGEPGEPRFQFSPDFRWAILDRSSASGTDAGSDLQIGRIVSP